MKIKSEDEEFNKKHQSYFSNIFDLFRKNLIQNIDKKNQNFSNRYRFRKINENPNLPPGVESGRL